MYKVIPLTHPVHTRKRTFFTLFPRIIKEYGVYVKKHYIWLEKITLTEYLKMTIEGPKWIVTHVEYIKEQKENSNLSTCSPSHEEFIRNLERLQGRKMTPQETSLSIAQAEMFGDL